MAHAFIFPGQGSQSVAMGQVLATASPEAAAVWREADAALDAPISELAWQGPAEQLDLTVNAQPALLAASIAALRALAASPSVARQGAPAFHAGHSMGQYSAMVSAGVLELADAMRLVRKRGELMQAASDEGAMAAILGLPEERIDALIERAGQAGTITVANRNSPGQIVLSGSRPAVEAAVAAARELGARRALPLPVSVAAHSPLMATAAEGMRQALAPISFRDPSAPLLANADATPLTSGEACRAELVDHLTRGVDWVAAVERMAGAGVDTFVEVGPGKVLTGLVRRIVPEATTITTDDITTQGGLELPPQTPAQE